MDMGFHCVESLSCYLYGRGHGYKCLGDRKKGKRCPSNYHVNYRREITCFGGQNAEGEHVPCFRDEDRVYKLRTGVGGDFGLGEVCPTCKGKGNYPNPDSAERFDLRHDDGYAISHRWL